MLIKKFYFRVWAGIVPVVPVGSGPGRLVPEHVPVEPAQALADGA